MLQRVTLVVAALVAVVALAVGATALWLRLPEGPLASLDPAIALEERDCGEGLPGARCGVVRVPLDHDDPEGEAIETGFALFPALVPWRGREEVVTIVGGGPGVPIVAMLREAPMWAFRLGLGGRPVLAIDPRGIGTSTRLECDALAGPVPLGEPVGPRITACAEEIGPRRAHFSTADTARDFELVRRALGIERLQLTAFSYGTNLAPVYARLHPEAVSSMVLDGAYPLTTYRDFLPEYHQAARRQFDLFCARSGACDGADAWAALGWAAAALREAPQPLDLPEGSAAARHGGAPMLDPSLLAASPRRSPRRPWTPTRRRWFGTRS